jgi:hypothetical protein
LGRVASGGGVEGDCCGREADDEDGIATSRKAGSTSCVRITQRNTEEIHQKIAEISNELTKNNRTTTQQ